jgi:hypothetical protein
MLNMQLNCPFCGSPDCPANCDDISKDFKNKITYIKNFSNLINVNKK